MAINYCTLSNSSVNAFCSNRRSIVLNRLIQELHPPVAQHKKRGGGPTPHITKIHRREIDEPTFTQTEFEHVVVTAKFQNLTGEDKQIVDQRLDFVFITNLEINPALIDVNITDLKIETLNVSS